MQNEHANVRSRKTDENDYDNQNIKNVGHNERGQCHKIACDAVTLVAPGPPCTVDVLNPN